jgi:hypothetical protein
MLGAGLPERVREGMASDELIWCWWNLNDVFPKGWPEISDDGETVFANRWARCSVVAIAVDDCKRKDQGSLMIDEWWIYEEVESSMRSRRASSWNASYLRFSQVSLFFE